MFHEDLRALLDFLEVEDVGIVAQSMGGRTAVGFAWRNPGRCRALVLAGTTGGAVDDEIRDLQAEHRQTDAGRATLAQRAISPALDERAEHLAFLYRSINRLNPPRPRDFLAAPPGYKGSSATLLAEAGFPILFLVGEEDAVTPPHIIERCHQAVPGSQLTVIKDSGHSTYFEQPEAFNDAVMSFLASSLAAG
jgi:pimeloyl-ACP methyl ester carboxylesterase